MDTRELSVPGAWTLTPRQHADARGVFLEAFTASSLRAATGRDLALAQVNVSVSRAGALRGIHFADVPPGQAKYVTCTAGAAFDVVVDLRVGSPTFGRWDAVLLDARDRRAVFVPEGLGHGFMALEDGTTMVYLCSQGYAPEREHEVHPTDPALGIAWPDRATDGTAVVPELSAKDAEAPTLAQALDAGILPHADTVAAFVSSLADGPPAT